MTVTTGSSLWLEAPRTCSVVAVTGTKGKSTVSALTAHLVEAAGRRVALAGNIGVPLIEVEGNAVDVTVAELSSYQVADLVGNVDLAVLTNLFPEHLDWHGGEDSYYRDKTRLLALAAGKAFVNGRCERSLVLTRGLAQRQLFGSAPGWEVSPAGVFVHGDQVAGRPSWPLRGAHNDINLAAALAAVDALGLDPVPLLPALADFRGLAHRQQRVHASGDLVFVDDSLATTPHATLAALDAFADTPVAVIVGGHDRGLDWSAFARQLAARPIAGVIARGDNGRRIVETLRRLAPEQPAETVADLPGAVEAAIGRLGGAGTVLLSPGAPSFGEFRDFRERGEAFQAIARQR